jgi:hypothetical protein
VLLNHGLGSEELLTTTPIEEPSYYSERGHEGHNLKKRVFGVRRIRFLECKCISSKKLHNGKPSNSKGRSEKWLAFYFSNGVGNFISQHLLDGIR